MMNLKVIGAGAAGNKAVIQLVENGFNLNDIALINSTIKDIPDMYRDRAMIFGTNSGNLGGCGKERKLGKSLLLADMKSGAVSFDGLADPDTNAVVIATSTEGGSGSSTAPIIAKYIKEVLGIPVIICLFFGFNDDLRGMKNSIDVCKELNGEYGIIGICNWKFLEECNGNKFMAEKRANEKFVSVVKTICGNDINPSSQNIDDTDLYKIITTPGYMKIESINIGKIKDNAQFDKAINNAINYSYLMDSPKGVKRIGIIINGNDDNIDYSFEAIKNAYGMPFEMFTHAQESKTDNTLTWIAAGLPMPIDEVQEIFDKYSKNVAAVNTKKDTFFDNLSAMDSKEDESFDMLSKGKRVNNKAKSSFFSEFGMGEVKPTSTMKVSVNNPKNEY